MHNLKVATTFIGMATVAALGRRQTGAPRAATSSGGKMKTGN